MTQTVFPPRHFLRSALHTVVAVLLLCASSATPSRAQQQQDDIETVKSNLVRLNIGVADPKGRAVTTLTRADFLVYEDGVQQSILNFETTEKPFSLVLLLDMSGSTLSFRTTLKQSALRFIDALGPADRVSVVSFWGQRKQDKKTVKIVDHIETLTDFTSDRGKIAFAIDRANGSGDTNLFRALQTSLNSLAKERERRQAIVVLTDGIDTDLSRQDRSATSQAADGAAALSSINADANPTLAAVLNLADRQGVTIYPLALPSGDLKRLAEPSPQQTAIYTSARTRLTTLATRTGGRLHEINRLEDIGRLYAEVAAEMRTLYSIAYQSTGSQKRAGEWRAIRIQVAPPDAIARTRPGYFAR